MPDPIASWDFEDGLTDSVSGLDGIPHGNVKIEEGKLVLGSGAYLTTPPLETKLTEKTLEAWVQLDNLDATWWRRALGAITRRPRF